jgi:hypothetical protein
LRSAIFNDAAAAHNGNPGTGCDPAALGCEPVALRRTKGSRHMTFAGRISIVTAYIALAFVGAIVLGVF